jgi:pantoate--beta-alanine ligase
VIIARTIDECRTERADLGKLALVPTMGALHAGHLSLVALAKNHAPRVAVSIFVNPTQFGPREDFNKYPRPTESDLKKCEKAGVDLVFLPAAQEVYRPELPSVKIDMPGLTDVLEGAHRPGHLGGVCQIVAKLFNIIQPQYAVFGKKDFQQLRVITAMTEALDFPLEIIPGPTLREQSGLAMSSRNEYLSVDESMRALSISRGLFEAESAFKLGIRETARLTTIVRNTIMAQNLSVDYVVAVDPLTLRDVERVNGPTVFAVAAKVGATRLIDNITIG